MVDVVGELSLDARFLLHGMHSHLMLLLEVLQCQQTVLIYLHDLAGDVAELVVGIVVGRHEVGIGRRILRKGTQHPYVAAEMPCAVIAHHRQHDSEHQHYPPEVLALLVEHERNLAAEGHHGVHLHAPVVAALHLIKEIGLLVLDALQAVCHVGRGRLYYLAGVVYKFAVVVDRHAYALVQRALLVVVGHEIDERQRVGIVLERGHHTFAHELQRLAHARVVEDLHIVPLPQGHAQQQRPHGKRQRHKKLPLIANMSP